jgi:hypothetical protein
MIADRDDRKFVALSAAAEMPLVTNDNAVLAQQRAVGIEILSPRAFVARKRLDDRGGSSRGR